MLFRSKQDLIGQFLIRTFEIPAFGFSLVPTEIRAIAADTGVYGYPRRAAVQIAIATVNDALGEKESVEKVVFCCFSDTELAICQSLQEQGPLAS